MSYFHARFRGVRAYAFSKLFLIMVALDTWMLMIGHAGRYGVAGFNVAHFAWLDALAPLPSPGLYVGVLLATGLLALSLALIESHPWAHALLFLLYTYSWSMSMLDSYQHHYFVSLILLCMVFFPRLHSRDLKPGELVSGFGYNLLGCSIAILYTYTSIAKMDPQWCEGFTLRRISTAGKTFAPLANLALSLGISNARFWALISTSVIPVELAIALGYALSIMQDESPSRALARAVHASFWLALSLHIGAELLGLEIGWFSYYMIVLACTFLLPGRAIEIGSKVVTWPASFIATHLDEPTSKTEARRTLETWLVVAAVSAVLFATSFLIDLPGARPTAVSASLCLFGLTLYSLFRERTAVMRRIALGVGCAAALMWAAIALSDVRWDFYRYLAGDLRRRGELQPALDAYIKGERYAPPGSSRKDTIDDLRRRLTK